MKEVLIKRFRWMVILVLACILQLSVYSQKPEEASLAREFVNSREIRLQEQTPRDRLQSLIYLTVAAYDSGDSEKAVKFAADLQREIHGWKERGAVSDRAYGIHASNTVLGLTALDKGQIAKAAGHLLDSATGVEQSLILQSFGPNMLLAKRLLEKGQSETVIQYLDRCSTFWKQDKGSLDKWKTIIKNGGSPDFGVQERIGIGIWKYAK